MDDGRWTMLSLSSIVYRQILYIWHKLAIARRRARATVRRAAIPHVGATRHRRAAAGEYDTAPPTPRAHRSNAPGTARRSGVAADPGRRRSAPAADRVRPAA